MSIPTNTGYEDLVQEISRLRSQLDKAEAEKDRLRMRKSSPEGKGLRGRLKTLRKELEEAEDEKQTLRSQNKKMKREIEELTEDLEDLNERMGDLRNRAQNQVGVDKLRQVEKDLEGAWAKNKDLEDENEMLGRRLRELERTAKEDRERLGREKEEAVEKTYKTIVELKTENEEEMEKMREDLIGKDKIIKTLMEEMRKIKDYISKLEREIFDLSQEKEKLEENLKKVMYEWENEELKRYSSDKQINGKLKGKDLEIQELRDKLQQIDSYHQDAKNEISRKADFYKKKSENLERTKVNLNKKLEKLEKTLKNKMEEGEGRGSHVEIGSVGVRTIEDRNDFGKTKENGSALRQEGDYEYERRQQISQTVKMDGDLVKMIYTQAKFIEERYLEPSESEEEEEGQEYEHYVQEQPEMYVNVDNTQSSNPQPVFANANRVMVDENGDKYLIESEADDGDKLVAAYMVNGQYMPITQMEGVMNPNQGMIQPNSQGRVPMNMVHHGGVMTEDPNSEGAEDEYEEANELIEDEYSDVEEEQMYMAHHDARGGDQVGNGHLVAGPVGGGMREEYEGTEQDDEIDYDEADEEDEEEFEDDEDHQVEEEGHEYHNEDFRMMQEQPEIAEEYQRKPALTFGIGQK